jgi:hypothetical protein
MSPYNLLLEMLKVVINFAAVGVTAVQHANVCAAPVMFQPWNLPIRVTTAIA